MRGGERHVHRFFVIDVPADDRLQIRGCADVDRVGFPQFVMRRGRQSDGDAFARHGLEGDDHPLGHMEAASGSDGLDGETELIVKMLIVPPAAVPFHRCDAEGGARWGLRDGEYGVKDCILGVGRGEGGNVR